MENGFGIEAIVYKLITDRFIIWGQGNQWLYRLTNLVIKTPGLPTFQAYPPTNSYKIS